MCDHRYPAGLSIGPGSMAGSCKIYITAPWSGVDLQTATVFCLALSAVSEVGMRTVNASH